MNSYADLIAHVMDKREVLIGTLSGEWPNEGDRMLIVKRLAGFGTFEVIPMHYSESRSSQIMTVENYSQLEPQSPIHYNGVIRLGSITPVSQAGLSAEELAEVRKSVNAYTDIDKSIRADEKRKRVKADRQRKKLDSILDSSALLRDPKLTSALLDTDKDELDSKFTEMIATLEQARKFLKRRDVG